MGKAIVETPDLIRVDQARGRSAPWRIRLEYVGDNPKNKSGESRKYWQVTAPAGWTPGQPVEIRYGALGKRGQTQFKPLSDALQRARKKLTKSRMAYWYDAQTGQTQSIARTAANATKKAVQTARRSFKERLLSTTQRPVDNEVILDWSALHGWTRADVGVDLANFIARAVQINVYIDRESRWWAVVRWDDASMTCGRLPAK
jgi:predicted DNA-binding WGR domain protein